MISRKLAVFLFLLFTLSLLGGCVDDSGTGPGFTNTIKEWLEWFFVNLFKPGTDGGVTDQGLVVLRILTGLLIFAILFGASQLVLKDYAKNVRLAISLLLGIISVIMIPGRLLAAVAKSYGVAFAAVMIGAPVLGGVYLMFGVFKEKNRTHWAANFGIAAVLWYILGSFSNVYLLDSASKSNVMGSLTAIASAVFFFLMIWYAFKIVTGEETQEEIPEEAKNAMKAVGRWFKTRKVGAVFTQAQKVLNELEAAMSTTPPNIPRAKEALKKEGKIMESFGEAIGRAQYSLDNVSGNAHTRLQGLVTGMESARNNVLSNLTAIAAGLNQPTPNERAIRGNISRAQKSMSMAVSLAVQFDRQ